MALSCYFSVSNLPGVSAKPHSERVTLAMSNIAYLAWLTQLAFGSRNLHHTPSSRTSFIFRHRFKKTASILLRRSIMLVSSFAFVGLAA